MRRIWTSAFIMGVIAVMTINSVSARNRMSSSARLLSGIIVRASNLDGILEKQALLDRKLSLSQDVQRLSYNLQGHRLIRLASTATLGKISLAQLGLRSSVDGLHLSDVELIKAIEAPKLQSSINALESYSPPSVDAMLHDLNGGALGQL